MNATGINFFAPAICLAMGLLAGRMVPVASQTLKERLKLIRGFLWMAAVPCALGAWLGRAPLPPDKASEIGFAPLFPGYRQLSLHRINQPKEGRKRVVILGASNMACWGVDYRGSLFDFRHKHDYWGRGSLAAWLETDLNRRGRPVRVENLALNGGDIFMEIALFLYAMERQPDLIIHGIVAPSFTSFSPDWMPELTSELPVFLAHWDYPAKAPTERSLQQAIRCERLAGKFTPNLRPTRWNGIVGRCGQCLCRFYARLGLPPLVVKIKDSPDNLKEADHIRNFPVADWYLQKEKTALTTGVDFLVVMHRIAQSQGVPYLVVFAPDLCRNVRPFYEEMGAILRERGVTVLNLSQLPLQFGTETYDGTHRTDRGNAIFAEAILQELSKAKIHP